MRLAPVALLLFAAAPAAARPPIRGFAAGQWSAPYDRSAAFDELAALGATHVSLVVSYRQKDVHASELGRGAATIPDDELVANLRAARARGLAVMLFPIVELDRVADGEWRGTLAARDPDRWWTSYEAFILHYAKIAAAEGVAVFSVGSELGSTEGWRDRWIHLIAAVENVFPGELTYSANWDHYQHVSFWERLDYVGVNGYFAAGEWDDARARLVELGARYDRPLLLTEVGLPSARGAMDAPWDYTRDAEVDLDEQRRGYQAIVDAWDDELALAGVFFWIWDGEGGAGDRGYTPRGKPAEEVVRRWFVL